MILCISLSGKDTLNSKRIPFNLKRMHPVFEYPISSFTSTATREGSSVAHLYLLGTTSRKRTHKIDKF